VAAEAALMKHKAEKMSALWKEGQGRAESEAARLEARIMVLKERHKETLAAAEVARESRSALIQRAYHSSKSSLAKVAQGKKDRRIGQVQGAIMRNRQERQQQLEDATEQHRQFIEQVLADRMERRKLRSSLLSSIRSFRPMLGDWFDARRAKFDEVEISPLPEKNHQQCKAYLTESQVAIDAISRMPLVKLFRYLPLWIITLAGAALFLAYAFQAGGDAFKSALPWYLGGMFVVILLWLAGFFGSRATIRKAAESLAAAAKLELAAENQSTTSLADLTKEIEEEASLEKRNLSETFRESDEEWRARLAEGQRRLEARHNRLPERLSRLHQRKLDRIKSNHEAAILQARHEATTRATDYESGVNQVKAAIDAETEAAMKHLADSWQADVASAAATCWNWINLQDPFSPLGLHPTAPFGRLPPMRRMPCALAACKSMPRSLQAACRAMRGFNFPSLVASRHRSPCHFLRPVRFCWKPMVRTTVPPPALSMRWPCASSHPSAGPGFVCVHRSGGTRQGFRRTHASGGL
jgi:DNA segregation ATPase FtsK/SpoIIIE, S-DNA-T family